MSQAERLASPKDLLPVKYKNPATSDLNVTVTAGGKNEFTLNLQG
jgi:hypothetical protein